MVSVCKTWSLPSANIVGLCSSMYDPPPGQNTCPVCAMPVSPIGATGCCDCSSTEQFPAIWRFDSGFSIGGSYADPEVTTDTDAACLLNVNPAGSDPAVATTTRYRIDLASMGPKLLIRGAGAGGAPACVWGNGDGNYDGWSHHPTYGTQSPPLGGCPITRGYTEKRCSFPYSGPYVASNGSIGVGGGLSSCVWPTSVFNWTGIGDTPYDGATFNDYLWYENYPCNIGFAGAIAREVFVKRRCWGWALQCLACGLADQCLTLSLKTTGYAYTSLDKIISVSDGFSTKWVHDELGAGFFCISPQITGETTGAVSWSAVYPCGNPATITLSLSSPGEGMFSGLSFPSTITLRAVY